jgi:8-amino-7-oxononanoate synthase
MFGMEGDAVGLCSLLGALRAGDVLLLDEAHALGVAGEGGGGLAYGIDDARIVVMGTLSKAFGAFGGFIAGPAPVIDYFQSTARTFIFDTALPPALAEAARMAVQVARDSDAGRSHLAMLGQHLRRGLGVLGYPVPPGSGHIVPVLVGDEASTLALAAALRELGISAPAIRPPTVPAGTCRLRISLRSTHTTDDVDRLLAGLPRR